MPKAGWNELLSAHPRYCDTPSLFRNLFLAFVPSLQDLSDNRIISCFELPEDQIIPGSVKRAEDFTPLCVQKRIIWMGLTIVSALVWPPLKVLAMFSGLRQRTIAVSVLRAVIGFEPF